MPVAAPCCLPDVVGTGQGPDGASKGQVHAAFYQLGADTNAGFFHSFEHLDDMLPVGWAQVIGQQVDVHIRQFHRHQCVIGFPGCGTGVEHQQDGLPGCLLFSCKFSQPGCVKPAQISLVNQTHPAHSSKQFIWSLKHIPYRQQRIRHICILWLGGAGQQHITSADGCQVVDCQVEQIGQLGRDGLHFVKNDDSFGKPPQSAGCLPCTQEQSVEKLYLGGQDDVRFPALCKGQLVQFFTVFNARGCGAYTRFLRNQVAVMEQDIRLITAFMQSILVIAVYLVQDGGEADNIKNAAAFESKRFFKSPAQAGEGFPASGGGVQSGDSVRPRPG